MKKKIFLGIFMAFLIGVVISFGISYTVFAKEYKTLSVSSSKNAVTTGDETKLAYDWLEDSGEAEALEYEAYNSATSSLENMVKQPSNKPKAVILDIDETCLNNAPFEGYQIESGDKDFDYDAWCKWVNYAEATAIPGSVAFTQEAKKLGVQVFYVSGRSQDQLAATVKNLSDCGFADASEAGHVVLYPSTQQGKQPTFDQIEQKYDVVMFVGDQLTDMGQSFEGKTNAQEKQLVTEDKNYWGNKYVTIPDPLYGNYLNSIYNYSSIPEAQELKMINQGVETFNPQTGKISNAS